MKTNVELQNASITTRSDIKQHIADLHPMKRLGKSEEITNGFIFLASGEGSFMNDTAMEIEGGYLAQ